MYESMDDSFHSLNEIFHFIPFRTLTIPNSIMKFSFHSIPYFNNSIFHTEIFLPFHSIFHFIPFHSMPGQKVRTDSRKQILECHEVCELFLKLTKSRYFYIFVKYGELIVSEYYTKANLFLQVFKIKISVDYGSTFLKNN